MINNKRKMTSKDAKTFLFASLIVAMVLPFSAMNVADAQSIDQKDVEGILQSMDNVMTQDIAMFADDNAPKISESILDYDQINFDSNGAQQTYAKFGGMPFLIEGQSYALILEQEYVDTSLDSSFTIETELEEIPVQTFEGTVHGISDSYVILTMYDGIIEGYVTIDGETFFVESLSNFGNEFSSSAHIIYSINDVVFPEFVDDEEATNTGEPIHDDEAESFSSPEVYASSTKYARVLIDCDKEFKDEYGKTSSAKQKSFLNAIKKPFQSAGVTFSYPMTTCDSSNSKLKSTNVYSLENQLEQRWKNQSGNADVILLLTGKDLSGCTNGKANLIPAIDNAAHERTAIAQVSSDSSCGKFKSYANYVYTIAHEMGHTFGAYHKYQGKCILKIGNNCVIEAKTIMNQGTKSGWNTGFYFSDGSVKPQNNNHAIIKYTAIDHL